MATRAELEKHLDDPRVQAFLAMIRDAEGTSKGADPYRVYGGSHKNQLESLDKPTFHKWGFKQTDGKNNSSTATGAYQFLERTWKDEAKKLGLKDFSPESQDLAAVSLLSQNGALKEILSGDFNKAVAKSNRTWASLPGSPYSQKTRSTEFVNSSIQRHLGDAPEEGNQYAAVEEPQNPKTTPVVSKTSTSQTPPVMESVAKIEEVAKTANVLHSLLTLAVKVWGLFRKR
jgi:muramidase (phage lysozyme)